jgi:hypothetical protein
MPHLRIKGLEYLAVEKESTDLINGISEIINCDRKWITIEVQDGVRFVYDGKPVETPIFVEIHWFDRGQEAKGKVAKFIDSILQRIDSERDRTVIFRDMKTTDYFENGEHF